MRREVVNSITAKGEKGGRLEKIIKPFPKASHRRRHDKCPPRGYRHSPT
jgi:hypothetical protein